MTHVDTGWVRVVLNLDIPEGVGHLLRCADLPEMFRNGQGGLNYPYPLGNLGQITSSRFGDEWYYYFYDWEVKGEEFKCNSSRTETVATVHPFLEGVEDLGNDAQVSIYPNPTEGSVTLDFSVTKASSYQISLFSITGSELLSDNINLTSRSQYQLEMDELPKGIYLVQIKGNDAVLNKRILVQ